MITARKHHKIRKQLLSAELDWYDSVHLLVSKHDADVYRIICDGFIEISSEEFSDEYSNSIRGTYEYRARLINNLLLTNWRKFLRKKRVIRVNLLYAIFNQEIDEFYLVASLYEPEPVALLILEERRELVLAECPLHRVVLAERAAREALNELEKSESGR